MRESLKKYISIGANIDIGFQRTNEFLDTLDKLYQVSERDHNIELRKRMKGFKTLPNAVDVEVTWVDPKTKQEWNEVFTREKFNEWLQFRVK